MQKTILHIGYPKTATTWFIRQFYPAVKNASVIYADDVEYDLANGHDIFKINADKINTNKALQILIAHKFCGFVEGMWEDGIYRPFFLKHLKRTFPDASIIIFIRNQLDFVPSLYSSYLRRGGTYKLKELFSPDKPVDKNFFSYEFLNYPEFIKLYQVHFGIENVHLFVYEDFLENNLKFLESFCQQFTFEVDLKNLRFLKSNEKLRKGLTSFVRHSNMLISQGKGPKNNIINFPFVYSLINKNLDNMNKYSIWGKKPDRDKMLGEELKSYINEYFKESNNELINCFGLHSIKKHDYPL